MTGENRIFVTAELREIPMKSRCAECNPNVDVSCCAVRNTSSTRGEIEAAEMTQPHILQSFEAMMTELLNVVPLLKIAVYIK
jgi:hypothetical protein